MTYLQLAYLHLATVVPAFLLEWYVLLARKGTATHRLVGKVYMACMVTTAT